MGGKDSASPRYIFTYLEAITDKIFRKEDASILRHLDDDGMMVEPEYYLPTIPLLLINGCVGIGTGFSTDIPPYNPADIVRVLRDRLMGRLSSLRPISLKPWWQGFKGEIVANGDGCWVTKGLYTMNHDKKTITITELPVGVWTKDYKALLDEMCVDKPKGDKKGNDNAYTDSGDVLLKSFDDLYTDEEVTFVLHFDEDGYEDMKAHPEDFEKRFRLSSSWRTTNMVAFDPAMKITKYGKVGHILEAFYEPRLEAYEVRRCAEMKRLEAEAVEADAKARFIRAVLAGTLDLRRATDEQVMERMKAHDLPALSATATATASGQSLDGWEYLLRLRMDRVKATAIEDAEKAVEIARAAAESLRNTTASQLWLKDLDELEVALEKMVAVRKEVAPKKKIIKKKST